MRSRAALQWGRLRHQRGKLPLRQTFIAYFRQFIHTEAQIGIEAYHWVIQC